jgi:chondroitin-sulfate-ABC endolyase/exolyase
MGLCFIPVEPAEQVRWLNAWKAMAERSILQPSSGFKIDGSAYHHHGHYHSYAQSAFANFPRVLQELRDTPWRLCPEAHERVRRAMLTQRLYAARYDLPLSLTGRSPFAASENCGRLFPWGIQGLEVLALLGTPDGKEAVDREVAAAYLRLAPEAADKEPYRSLGIKPEPEPNGTFVLPYAALLCHRRDYWLAAVKGQSKYCWGSERQAQRNAYGLFQGLGSLELLAGGKPVSQKASGCEQAGWDWGRFEGTTVPRLPLKQLDKGWSSISMTVGSPETFVGGLSHQGRQGVFAMVMNQSIAPEHRTLKGKKTWFFSDDRILCLGSDISCDEAQYPTQTTLCQKAIQADAQGKMRPTTVDGVSLTDFPDEKALDQAKPHWFLDAQQTGYYLPAGQNVALARKHQTSRDVNDREDTQGDFLTVWLDPKQAQCNRRVAA